MTHFAIPDGDFSPSEAVLASMLDRDLASVDGFMPLGLLLVAKKQRMTIVLIAMATGLDVDGRWPR